jgi:type VI secretion system protein
VIDPNEVVASIMHHLQKILNTRQGSAPIDDDYGMPDFTDLAMTFSPESVKRLARSIKYVINKYETRMRDVVVEATPKGEQPWNCSSGAWAGGQGQR